MDFRKCKECDWKLSNKIRWAEWVIRSGEMLNWAKPGDSCDKKAAAEWINRSFFADVSSADLLNRFNWSITSNIQLILRSLSTSSETTNTKWHSFFHSGNFNEFLPIRPVFLSNLWVHEKTDFRFRKFRFNVIQNLNWWFSRISTACYHEDAW